MAPSSPASVRKRGRLSSDAAEAVGAGVRGRTKQQQIDELTKQNYQLIERVAELSSHIKVLTEQLSELQRMLFGRRSEKIPPD